MLVSEKLLKLAKILPSPLYIVGGAVRDHTAGFKVSDLDICAALTPEEVAEAVKADPDIHIYGKSPKLGTIGIKYGDEDYEYTAFRTDNYTFSGAHTPQSVSFTRDIKEDALRRDFTVNAVYYDVQKSTVCDPLGIGVKDIKNKIIRTVRDGETVFGEDALRLMRLARIAAQTGFSIDINTFKAAEKSVAGLKNIANERLGDEFSKILIADTVNGISGAHIRGINILVEIGAMEYLIPELLLGIGFKQRPDYHLYDVYGHIMKVLELIPPSIRYAALFHDITKPREKTEHGKMAGHPISGAKLSRDIMRKFGISADETERVARLVENHMYDLNLETSENKVRRFIQSNIDIIDDLVCLKDADYEGGGILNGKNPSGLRLIKVREKMIEDGVPFSIKDLKVNGDDLIAANIPEKSRGTILKELLVLCATDNSLLNREAQLKFIERKRGS